MILQSAITGRAHEKTPSPTSPWVGRQGRALTDLRPVGLGQFDHERMDVIAEEGFIPKGSPIEIVRDEGYRKVVRKVQGG